MENFETNKKTHRERHSGRKAEKKSKRRGSINQDLTSKQQNPKAFAFNSAIGAERKFRRKQDIETKKQHVPLVDRTPIEPPPLLIAVVGPPKVGKTTLIDNLVKSYSKSHLTDIKGPVTVVTGKKRRITLIECNNDINSMIDLAKVADLALLLCDSSFGFEMEIFEFINICQVHGMPRIMGILTHLDMIKNSKTLKNTKKKLKHRFWTEVYSGAKLFYLSGIFHGEYLRNEIKNLGRFISIMKFRPLTWRLTHSYLLADRYEDLTSSELIRQNAKCDRNISLYGYVRGVPLKGNTSIHIAGFGDMKIHDISYLPDPCPLPETVKRRALVEKEKLIYAPFSGVGGIVYDKDAVYFELGGSHSHKERNSYVNNIVTNLIETKETLDVKMQHSEFQLFTGGRKIIAHDLDDLDTDDSDLEEIRKLDKRLESTDDVDLNEDLIKLGRTLKEEKVECDGRIRRKVVFEDSDDDCVKTKYGDILTEFAYSGIKSKGDSKINSKVSNILKVLENSNKNNSAVIHKFDNDTNRDISQDIGVSEKFERDDCKGQTSNEEEDADDFSRNINSQNNRIEVNDDEMSNAYGEGKNLMDDEHTTVEWKENLTRKARESYLARLQMKKNIMKIVYGVFEKNEEQFDQQSSGVYESDEIGGLFRIVSREQQKLKVEIDSMDIIESSLLIPWSTKVEDFTHIENKWKVEDCFVTGKWKQFEDASELLKIDTAEILSDSDEFGDFEDLETGEKLVTDTSSTQKRKRNDEQPVEKHNKMLKEKKLKLKQKFDAEYDHEEGPSYYDELKLSAEKQSQLNKSVFDNMTDDLRVQFEGYRPGMYVRIEIKNVASEFVTNFDPTYPIILGALNMGEENIGYVNVKMKKHRWYKRILKANDPIIISLGWRRFQTLPLYSKLEDDFKFRYLKYTPEHLSCNAHFWGPITPQGSGFLALQTCGSDPEIVKTQGYRIAATGTVQELDKSTKVMKKLKLVGYPMKIYKKTAFIRGMFSSSLEVAKFEGAKIKTVSGIRGQIKKAVNKPEGCFRATFEDKLQLSDIVFCRTWYKVDVQKFYAPITTLLLPLDKKDSWSGVRTKGELKRVLNIRDAANSDSLYTEIVREPKVFKPLFIPRRLQHALPYTDKPNCGVKSTERKQSIDRVAVIKEPYEQKVSKVMKMIKTAYNHKQQELNVKTKKRLQTHRQMIEAIEAKKANKLKMQKKEVFRIKSRTQIREEKRTE